VPAEAKEALMASLLKRNGVYYGRHIYYVDGKRKEKKLSFDTGDKGAATKRLMRWEVELSAGKWGEAPALLFEEVAQRFLNEHCAGLAEASVERYKVSIKQLHRHFDGKKISDIGSKDMLAFELARRKDDGRYHDPLAKKVAGKPTKFKKVTTGSIRRDLNCLSSILTFAITKEWLTLNPVSAFLKVRKKSGGLRDGQARKRFLSPPEEERLLRALSVGPRANSHDGLMLHAAVIMAIDTGLRLEEMLSTEWQNVQLTHNPNVFVPKGTNDYDRKVPLFDRVAKRVSQLSIHQNAQFVFWRGRKGERMQDLKKGFAGAVARAGLVDVQWHDLRRTCACRLLKSGVPIEKVSRWLGHSSIEVTQRHYAFLDDDDLTGIVERDRARRVERPTGDIVQLQRA
jgi:integrase/recombinase XerD